LLVGFYELIDEEPVGSGDSNVYDVFDEFVAEGLKGYFWLFGMDENDVSLNFTLSDIILSGLQITRSSEPWPVTCFGLLSSFSSSCYTWSLSPLLHPYN